MFYKQGSSCVAMTQKTDILGNKCKAKVIVQYIKDTPKGWIPGLKGRTTENLESFKYKLLPLYICLYKQIIYTYNIYYL